MRFKEIDHLRYVPVVERTTITLLLFPPASHTPSGFYCLEPNGSGGNKITLLKKVDVSSVVAKAWYMSCSARQAIIGQELASKGEIRSLLETGDAVWSSLPAELLVERIMHDKDSQIS